jgi:hypothetical protein
MTYTCFNHTKSTISLSVTSRVCLKYDKQDQQLKAAFKERNPHTIQQQKPVARNPGLPKTKIGQGKRQIMGRLITEIIHKKI